MYEVNRVAAIIKPTQVMLNWLKDNSDTTRKYKLEDLRKDATVLMIPAFKGPKQAESFIHSIYEGIFETELTSWAVDEKTWPQERSYEIFKQWFSVEYHSLIFDIGDLSTPLS